MRSLTLLLGGARSGKSREAERLVAQHPPPWHYLATAQAFDDEMAQRIAEHRARRGPSWHTTDAPIDLVGALHKIPDGNAVLVDCLTLWLTNVMLAGEDVTKARDALVETLANPRGPWFVVSTEVGLGIVPENALARRFRDAAGSLHQKLAARADRVLLVVAGIPLQVK